MFMHEDDPGQGGAVPHEREELFVRLAQQVGATVLRTHYPFSPYMHELADRNGLMIWSEIPVYQVPRDILRDAGVRKLAARMLTDSITANGNHPSVMARSVGHASKSRPSEAAAPYLGAEVALAKRR